MDTKDDSQEIFSINICIFKTTRVMATWDTLATLEEELLSIVDVFAHSDRGKTRQPNPTRDVTVSLTSECAKTSTQIFM